METEWLEKYSKTHKRTYYYNIRTKESKWEDPRISISVNKEKESDKEKENKENDKDKGKDVEKVTINPKKEEVKEKVSFFDFLMECLRNEVNNEFVWDRRYDTTYRPPLFPEMTKTDKSDFGFYWIAKVPHLIKEIDYDLGVVAIISTFEKNLSLPETLLKDSTLKNALCGFRPSYEFNLAAFATFLGVQTQAHSLWRETVWKTEYKKRFDDNVVWDVTAESWNMISKVRVSLCTSYASKASLCFVREMEAFLQMVAQLK
jgi:hypothetical protein